MVAMHIYRLDIGFNTTSCLRGFFNFVILPPLPHYRFWGGILNIEFKANVFIDTVGGEFCLIAQVMGYFYELLKHYGLILVNCTETEPFVGPIKHMICCMKIYQRAEFIEAFI